jgi:uncharacterized protein YjbJ (UPF0337 family)
MNKDPVQSTIKDAAGKMKEVTGRVTAGADHRPKVVKKAAEGQAHKALGDTKEAVKGHAKP